MDKIPAIYVIQLCGELLKRIEKHQQAARAAEQRSVEQPAIITPALGVNEKVISLETMSWGDEQSCYAHSDGREQSA